LEDHPLAYTQEQIFDKVRDCFIEALGVEDDEVTMDATVIDDLGAESLDFLDIAFRLERAFDIKIPRGDLEQQAQDAMDGEPYEVDGVLTERALGNLKELMPEVPEEEFAFGLKTKEVPNLFRVATFHNLCVKLLEEKGELAAA
jgi:acyl carrier protein